MEGPQVAQRVGIAFERRVEEVAQDQAERLAVPDLMQASRGQDLRPRTVFSRHVAQVDGRVGGLLRGDCAREEVDPRVGHAHGAHTDLSSVADGHVQPGHGVEEGRLARAGEAGESESHGEGVVFGMGWRHLGRVTPTTSHRSSRWWNPAHQRDGHNAIRISTHVYNTTAEIERVAETLQGL